MKVKFWGVRGSIPTPGQATLKVGGNTPCVEVVTPENEIVVLDAGTGIRELGIELEKRDNLQIHLFFTHTHWDHIQGFPFFRPLFNPTNRVVLYGKAGVNNSLEDTLAGQMEYRYFPVQISDLQAKIRFEEIANGAVQVNGSITVFSREFWHPGGVLVYRVERGGRSLVYATDVEADIGKVGDELIEYARGADLLVMDCQFTVEEYRSSRKGWGHSTPRAAIQIAEAARVSRLAMFHHDPNHTDEMLEEVERLVQADFPNAFLARDGMELDL